MLKRLVDQGAIYRKDGTPVEPLRCLRESGIRCARLRLFHTPHGRGAQVNSLDYTRQLARQCVDAGMDVMLCMHFSDTWADPAKQYTPKAWADLSYDQTVEAVYEYTRSVIADLAEHGCCPRMVQVGNEITPGMLWEHGRIAHAHPTCDAPWQAEDFAAHTESWRKFSGLLKAAVRGVKDGASNPVKIVLHIDRGGNHHEASAFFDAIAARAVPYDVIGLSYYPFWHGTISDLKQTIRHLKNRFRKQVYLVETAFPHRWHPVYQGTPEARADADAYGIPPTRPVDYPLSPEGQQRFMSDMLRLVKRGTPGGLDALFYWAPEWIDVPGYEDEPDAQTCWSRALFDASGEALPALSAFARYATSTTVPASVSQA